MFMVVLIGLSVIREALPGFMARLMNENVGEDDLFGVYGFDFNNDESEEIKSVILFYT